MGGTVLVPRCVCAPCFVGDHSFHAVVSEPWLREVMSLWVNIFPLGLGA